MHEHEEHPLVKEVPGHLFQFEEKIFGMSLTQLLCDIGAGVGILSITASMSLLARILVSVLLAIPVLILVHGKVQEQALLHWLFLYGRQLFVPKHSTWQSCSFPSSMPTHPPPQSIKMRRLAPTPPKDARGADHVRWGKGSTKHQCHTVVLIYQQRRFHLP